MLQNENKALYTFFRIKQYTPFNHAVARGLFIGEKPHVWLESPRSY